MHFRFFMAAFLLALFGFSTVSLAQSAEGAPISTPAPRCVRTVGDPEADTTAGVTIPSVTQTDAAWTGSISTGVYSQYWAPAAGFPIYSKPVAQTEFDAVYTSGNREVGLLLWNSQGLHKKGWGSGGEEWDFGAFVAWKLPGNRRLELRDWHFMLGGEVRSDINNPSVKYSRAHSLGSSLVVTIFAKADGYIPTNSRGPDAGAIFAGGGTVEQALGHGLSASITAQAAVDPFGTFGFRQNAVIYRQDYGLKYTHGSWSVAPTLTFGGANDNERPGKITASLVFTRNFSFGRH